MENKMTHFDSDGNAVMVDVSEKSVTERTAVASGKIKVSKEVMDAVLHRQSKKGMCLALHRLQELWEQKRHRNSFRCVIRCLCKNAA